MSKFCCRFPPALGGALVATCLIWGNGTAAPTLPDTPPAQRVVELLEAFNTGDRQAVVDYALEHFTPGMLKPNVDSIVDFLMEQYAATGGYDIRRVVQSVDTQITVLVQSRTPDTIWTRLVIGAEADPPHRVQGLFTYRASAALAQEVAAEVTASELPARYTEMLDALVQAGDFSGSVCVAREGEVLVNRSWGLADRRAGTANTPTTLFGIASLGKMFTAVAILQLVDGGALSLDDRVAAFIPDWMSASSRMITVHQLLTHTSGLGDYLGPAIEDPTGGFDALIDYKRLVQDDEPAFEPGSDFRYSNTGYLLLGVLLQKISGVTWEAYLREHIFAPAGMLRTQAMRPNDDAHELARGYMRDAADRWRPNDDILVGRGTPAGGSASTAADLAAFAHALQTGRLVSEESMRRMTTPQVAMHGTGMSYGYGFTMSNAEGAATTFGHSGGFPGVSAFIEIYVAHGYVLAILSNQDNGAVEAAHAWRELLGRLVDPAEAGSD